MPITLDVQGNKMILTVIKSDKFNFDKDRIKKVPSVRTIWKEGKFLHWAADKNEICTLLERFHESEILATPAGNDLIEAYKTASTPLDQLEKIEDQIDFLRPPRGYQEDFIRMNPAKRRMILAYDPGLGKTLTSLERMSVLGFKNMVIIGPKVTMTNWRTEIRKTYGKECIIYHGNVKQRKKLLETIQPDSIVVSSFEMAKELNHLHFDAIIIDEAHLISRTSSQRYKDVETLNKNNLTAAMLLLSGTPILHKIVDLWTLVHLVAPEVAGSKYAWQDKYEEVLQSIRKTLPTGRVVTIPIKTRTRNLDHLQQRIASIMVRMKRNKVTTFKEITKVTTVELTPRQKDMYEQIRAGIIVELENERFWNSQNVLTRTLGLREVSEGSFNVDKRWNDSGKFDYVCHVLDNLEEGKKVVVWSAFREMTERLYERYKDRAVLFNGGVSDSRKKLAPWAFHGLDTPQDAEEYKRLQKYNPDWSFEPGKAQMFFATLDHRQGLGINLHSASYQLFTSFHPNFNVEKQAIDRLCRIGQEDDVSIEFVVSEGTIDYPFLTMALDNYTKTTDALDGVNSISSNQARAIAKMVIAGR